ncbi:hypothetical protein F4553_003184 [Allocatelliglobosispora scoriae]|uniref:Uncharacterized protein n=1 Tax=Allocatelliglobosispora scoriae TaxID=643052 RepID=A0A841BQ34_9ACTN|nr:hypothetical protein [Allocatelliglobosispora scoriae]MBB5869805.1 hypothetical protein [Allocatelliglobosispora scoriae]
MTAAAPRSDTVRPRSIRLACWFMLGIALTGLIHVVASVLELRRLDANEEALAKLAVRPEFSGVVAAAQGLRIAAIGALIVGAVAALLAPVTWALLRSAVRWARRAVLTLHFVLLGGVILLLAPDSTTGIKPYRDPMGSAANEDVAASLLAVPGYLAVHYAAEVVLLVLAAAVLVLSFRESTTEFLRSRWSDGDAQVWDMSPSLAKLRGERTAR